MLINRNFFIVITILLTLSIAAMEETPPEKKTLESFYYLHLLPKEILNEIAKYLPSRTVETDAAFLARIEKKIKDNTPLPPYYRRETSKLDSTLNCSYLNATFELIRHSEFLYHFTVKHIPTDISTLLCKLQRSQFSPLFKENKEETYFACSADLSKILLYNQHKGVIVGFHEKEILQKYDHCYAALSENNQYRRIAISNNGHYISKILELKEGETNRSLFLEVYTQNNGILTKHTIPNEKTNPIKLCINKIPFLEFNQQNTQIMLYYRPDAENDIEQYQIFTLVDENEHTRESIKTLPDYFRQLGVCKDITPKG